MSHSEYTANIELAHQTLALEMGKAWAKPAPKRNPRKIPMHEKTRPVWRYVLACIVCAICAFLLSTNANAEGIKTGAEVPAFRFGVHALSFHTAKGYETITPGLYAIHSSGAAAGFYRNSEGKPSAYAGWSLERGQWNVLIGAVTGYKRAKVLPMLAPGYRFASGMRVSVIPNPFGASALHLSADF